MIDSSRKRPIAALDDWAVQRPVVFPFFCICTTAAVESSSGSVNYCKLLASLSQPQAAGI